MSWTYLASPYSHPDPLVREERFRLACKAAAMLMARGEIVFCPIAHSHPIEVEMPDCHGHEFWLRQDQPFLAGASKIVLLKIDGWDASKGVAYELAWAEVNNIPVEILHEPAREESEF